MEIYSDRMEISNPGKSIVSPEHFIDENQSRNERLADIDKVISAAEVCQLPAPLWRSGERHTLAVLFAHKGFEDMDGTERVRACFQHCVLRYLTNRPMNNQSLRERFNLPDSKTELVSGIIADAIAQGKIKPENPANTSRRYAKYVPHWA